MTKQVLTGIVVVLIIGSIMFFELQKPERPSSNGGNSDIAVNMTKEEKARQYEPAKEISTPDGFINTQGKPITIGEFVGKKVVLLDIWTYSCINCQRTLPYLNAWQEKYKDQGLEIIGLHTPEFDFEKKYDNVVAAVKKFGIQYPVVLDNDFFTWNAYGNRYWPRKYLIDIDGFVVYDHIGEGGYEETEKKIQELLQERMATLGEKGSISSATVKPAGAQTEIYANSPETYFGAARNSNLGNGSAGQVGMQSFTAPLTIDQNKLYLAGDWNFTNEYAENAAANGVILFRYNARDVYFVASAETATNIRVLQDGKPLGAASGGDVTTVNGESIATIHEDRLYKLIHNETPGEHILQIIIAAPKIKAFTFTFG